MLDGYSVDWGTYCDAWKLNPHGPARRPCGMTASHDIGGVIYLCRFHYKSAYNDIYFNVVVEKDVRPVLDEHGDAEMIHQHEMFMIREVVNRLTNKTEELQDENVKLKGELAELKSTKITNVYQPKKSSQSEQLVYFIRCEGFVKIGISSNPEKRLLALRRSGNGTLAPPRIDLTTAEIVTTESGGRAKESKLHGMFDYLRIVGEWFIEEPEITEYIDNVRFDREQISA